MAHIAPITDILVLGVGFTGLLVAEALAKHRERSKFTFAIAGRSQRKLDQTVARPLLKGINAHCVDVAKSDELRRLVVGFRVVINCTSQYWKLGIPVVSACVSAGTHYLDLTGELPFYFKSVALFDATGERQTSASVVIHACGYESIPSDIVAFESVQKLRQRYGPNTTVSTSTTAMALDKAFVSRGTIVSGISMLRDVPRDLFWKSLEPFSLSPIQGTPPRRMHLYDLKPHVALVGSFFLLSANNIAAVNRTWGLLQSIKSAAAYGEEFTYNEFLVASSSSVARLTSILSLFTAWMLIYLPPIRWLVEWLLDRESANPTYKDLETGSLTVTNVTMSVPLAHDSTPHCAKTVFKTIGGDGGYMGSAVTVTECALLLVLHDPSALPLHSFTTSRVLTPVAAFGSMLTKRLVDSGFYEITTEILQ
ncbi:Saccharopine dehydrogenase-domain-containing protein [Mycena pura]|uniref:Saccharopine dehydrogenase-domain-containing protein n=1 Tax=Mycena pura TaxID=153505 RepID=A0AAD6ULU3_9AGAR|nr:Saccharopine dehydrogenase-domain-containing protein [Mycena pura]